MNVMDEGMVDGIKVKVSRVTVEMTPKDVHWIRTILNHTGGPNEVVLESAARELGATKDDLKQFVLSVIGIFTCYR